MSKGKSWIENNPKKFLAFLTAIITAISAWLSHDPNGR